MKKLTNKTDTFNALDKFGLEMQGEDLITSKGNLKGEAVDEEQLEKELMKFTSIGKQKVFLFIIQTHNGVNISF